MQSHNHLEPTQVEIEVINFLSKGYTNKEIAGHLDIALRTVEHRLESAYQKLDAHGRVDAIVKALKAGWISLNSDFDNEE